MIRREFAHLNPDAGALASPVSVPDGREIIYLSSDGSETNDGRSPDSPRSDIKRVPEYLKDGYNVLLKAGSEWHEPMTAWKLFDIHGSADKPLVVGTYAEGKPPVVAGSYAIRAEDWQNEKDGILSAVVSGDVVRCYIADELIPEVASIEQLCKDGFVQTEGKIYIRATEPPTLTELITVEDGVEPQSMITFRNVSYLTLENFVIKGSPHWCTVYGIAPTDHFKLDHMELKCIFKYCTSITSDPEDLLAYHNAFTVTNSVIERTWSNKAQECFREDIYAKTRTADGIFMTNAHIGAYIGGNKVRDFGHTAIDLEVVDKRFVGIHNCMIERNVVSGTNAQYLRACETIGPDGKCTNNCFRYNYCYDLTNSSHLLGENNKYYCNVFAYIVPTEVAKVIQPFAIDSMSWVYKDFEFVARGNVIANNTIYGCHASLAFGGNNYTNTVVNNLMIGWSYEGAVRMGETKEPIRFLNNCYFSDKNANMLYGPAIDKEVMLDELNAREGCSGNLIADPCFSCVDNGDFSLKNGSPCAASGLAFSEFIDAPYLDMNGNEFDPEHPTIGAFSLKK